MSLDPLAPFIHSAPALSVKQLALFAVAAVEFSRSSLHSLKFERRGFQMRRPFGHAPGGERKLRFYARSVGKRQFQLADALITLYPELWKSSLGDFWLLVFYWVPQALSLPGNSKAASLRVRRLRSQSPTITFLRSRILRKKGASIAAC